MANIHVWDRTMEEEELRQKTSCSQTVEDQGSLVNHRCVDISRLSYLHTGSLKIMVAQKLHLRAIKRHQIKF